jgi:hypothetical protein
MGTPQIIMMCLYVISIIVYIQTETKPKAIGAVLGVVTQVLLLWWGGFWH